MFSSIIMSPMTSNKRSHPEEISPKSKTVLTIPNSRADSSERSPKRVCRLSPPSNRGEFSNWNLSSFRGRLRSEKSTLRTDTLGFISTVTQAMGCNYNALVTKKSVPSSLPLTQWVSRLWPCRKWYQLYPTWPQQCRLGDVRYFCSDHGELMWSPY